MIASLSGYITQSDSRTLGSSPVPSTPGTPGISRRPKLRSVSVGAFPRLSAIAPAWLSTPRRELDRIRLARSRARPRNRPASTLEASCRPFPGRSWSALSILGLMRPPWRVTRWISWGVSLLFVNLSLYLKYFPFRSNLHNFPQPLDRAKSLLSKLTIGAFGAYDSWGIWGISPTIFGAFGAVDFGAFADLPKSLWLPKCPTGSAPRMPSPKLRPKSIACSFPSLTSKSTGISWWSTPRLPKVLKRSGRGAGSLALLRSNSETFFSSLFLSAAEGVAPAAVPSFPSAARLLGPIRPLSLERILRPSRGDKLGLCLALLGC